VTHPNYLFENGTNYKKNFGSFSAFCAGSATYMILLALGVKELFLLGLDLAVSRETLQTHSKEYKYVLQTKEEELPDAPNPSLVERRTKPDQKWFRRICSALGCGEL